MKRACQQPISDIEADVAEPAERRVCATFCVRQREVHASIRTRTNDCVITTTHLAATSAAQGCLYVHNAQTHGAYFIEIISLENSPESNFEVLLPNLDVYIIHVHGACLYFSQETLQKFDSNGKNDHWHYP